MPLIRKRGIRKREEEKKKKKVFEAFNVGHDPRAISGENAFIKILFASPFFSLPLSPASNTQQKFFEKLLRLRSGKELMYFLKYVCYFGKIWI